MGLSPEHRARGLGSFASSAPGLMKIHISATGLGEKGGGKVLLQGSDEQGFWRGQEHRPRPWQFSFGGPLMPLVSLPVG